MLNERLISTEWAAHCYWMINRNRIKPKVTQIRCSCVSSYFDLTDHEREAMNVMLQYVKRVVDERFHPDGYNIGINVGQAAGQSVYHCHMHLIPRYAGDVENPKGGVRGVIPKKQKYWEWWISRRMVRYNHKWAAFGFYSDTLLLWVLLNRPLLKSYSYHDDM